jgi:hypothetical protein
MSAEDARRVLDEFLTTDPADVGCDQAVAMMHVYVEILGDGEDAAARYPGIAAHLRACGPCGDDYEGLLRTIRDADSS